MHRLREAMLAAASKADAAIDAPPLGSIAERVLIFGVERIGDAREQLNALGYVKSHACPGEPVAFQRHSFEREDLEVRVDPIPHMLACKQILGSRPKAELLWASTRELLNIFHAEESSCDIVTVPNEFLNKLDLIDKDLAEYSRETVQLFYRDATAAAYQIKTTRFAAE